MTMVRSALGVRGAILMFHEINVDPEAELMTGCSAAFLDAACAWLKRSGWTFVDMDEALRRASDDSDSQRFIVVTFDDGYRDTLTRALPILERYGVPFVTYVPTGALTRTLNAWWLGLRELVRTHDSVIVEPMKMRFDCPDVASKCRTLSSIQDWVHRDLRRAESLAAIMSAAGISMEELNERYFLDESGLRSLARHPLVSIGGHTTSHAALAYLDTESVRHEMNENRAYLAGVLDRPVEHFAYPYGHAGACGRRDAEIADEVGFRSGVTTRSGPLLAHDLADPYFLPRIWVGATTSIARLSAGVSGFERAVRRAAGIGSIPVAPTAATTARPSDSVGERHYQ